MRKNAVVTPLVALLAGACGFFIRHVERNTAFDSGTGFAQSGAAITYVMIAFSAAVFICAVAFSVLMAKKYAAPKDYAGAFHTGGVLYPCFAAVCGVLWIAAAVLLYMELSAAGSVPIIDLVFMLFAAAAAVALIRLANTARTGLCGKGIYGLSVIPTLFFCFWLILLYKENASNPVLLSYCYQCLAIAASALSFYYTSGYVFGKAAPGKTLASYIMTIFLCAVSLADGIGLAAGLLFGATLIYVSTSTAVFIGNLTKKEGRTETP